MGRRKIEIEPLTDDRNRSVTFVKRKAGLFKKAYELSVLCEVDLAVIIVGSNNKVYEFSSVETNELLKSYRGATVHESKLLENYGKYKKRPHLKSWPFSALNNDSARDAAVDDGDSDDDSEVSEPKRHKRDASSTSIYSQQSNVSSQFAYLAGQKQLNQILEQDPTLQRPVLRVQIPTDTKPNEILARTVTDVEGSEDGKDKLTGNDSATQSLHQNAIAYSLRKFKSPDSKKPPLPLPPAHKLQTLSPLSATTHPLPISSNAQFYSLPPPSPSGNFAPSILPTPVFNQVFNPLFMNPMNVTSNTLMPLNPNVLNGPASVASGPGAALSSGNTINPSSTSSTIPLSSSRPQTSDAPTTANTSNLETEAPKLKPPLQQATNGEQTPISGLPSRYMNDIFPSPSNFYASQEWPTGMTPFSTSMSHYFVSMAPSAAGATPLQLNQAYSSTNRGSHLSASHKPTAALLTATPPQVVPPVPNGNRKPSLSLASDGMGQFFKRELN
ncbi:hypothetical protein PUMCH_001935 [Australozyma saopauloensis]|uniref:MADS-box domain-containing protein n=1 Tax=Australozyma saopauloensis TaxID=291208 RepID=A0AAX4H7U2_9ASCO|nr:hypothetical protein PUMCH_001935 [[Candida] saopauloensis]